MSPNKSSVNLKFKLGKNWFSLIMYSWNFRYFNAHSSWKTSGVLHKQKHQSVETCDAQQVKAHFKERFSCGFELWQRSFHSIYPAKSIFG